MEEASSAGQIDCPIELGHITITIRDNFLCIHQKGQSNLTQEERDHLIGILMGRMND